MVFHDHLLDRTTNARANWKRRRIRISQKTAPEIQTLDAGSWFDEKFAGTKVSRLTETLDFICGNGGVALIEHKSGDAATLAGLLRERDLINKVVIISFNWKFLREFHELEPQQILGALGPPSRLSNGRRPVHLRRRLGSRLSDLLKTGARIAVWNKQITPGSLLKARRYGIPVWVYTVNDKKVADRLRALGVSGLITDKIRTIAQL
jgi:glycerophosphoryl diester phosphodiesterase